MRKSLVNLCLNKYELFRIKTFHHFTRFGYSLGMSLSQQILPCSAFSKFFKTEDFNVFFTLFFVHKSIFHPILFCTTYPLNPFSIAWIPAFLIVEKTLIVSIFLICIKSNKILCSIPFLSVNGIFFFKGCPITKYRLGFMKITRYICC